MTSASAYFFNKIKPSIYVVPKLGVELSSEVKLQQITKPWLRLKVFNTGSPADRLPEHYKQFYWMWKHAPKAPVHYDPEKGNFKLSPDKLSVVPIVNEDVQLVYPDNCNDGLWGGEGIIKGFYHLGRYKGEIAKYWPPALYMTVIYSEILDRHMEIMVTRRCLRLIDKHYGLDFYLLETPYCDINSLLGFRLKREMLLALGQQTLYPADEGKREEVTEKYRRYTIPVAEADWIGLSLEEATIRQQQQEAVLSTAQPLKAEFRAQLIQYLKDNPDTESSAAVGASEQAPTTSNQSEPSSWIKKYNPFKKT